MKLFLNTTVKGLLVALLMVTLGGFLYINIKKPEEINLKLISSSLVNKVGTSASKEQEEKKDNDEILVEGEFKTKSKEVETNEQEEKSEIEETSIEEKTQEVLKEEISENNDNNINNNNTSSNDNKNNNSNNDNNNNNNNQSEANPKPNGYAPNMAAVNASNVINTYKGNITAYGPDCVGCGGMVAHGEYVGGGNIYYNDKTYGNIRIVAGDRNLEFGTIVKISGLNISSEPIIAIMLDTGGAIGFNKGIYFDLLYPSEADTYDFGCQAATFEILRSGF